jgi:flagellin-like hook-associated protein FlgL
MAKDTQAANIAAGAATPATDKTAANEASSSAETPKTEPETPAIEAEAPAVIGRALILSAKAPDFSARDAFGPSEPEPEVTEATVVNSSRWRLPGYAPLAAGIVLAVAIGAIAGAAAISTLRSDTSAAAATVADETRALKATVAQLNSELTALKSGLSNAQRAATAQMGKLTERLDRAEKAQAEPASKLARITETVDRLEKRQQTAAPAVTAAVGPDITGSIPPPKEETRPPVAEGWRLVDFHQGRAVVESRNGALFEVGPGSNLPGLGRVETIRRENGRLVVVAKNGIITALSEERRPPYVPYRY